MTKYVFEEYYSFEQLPDDDAPMRKCRAIVGSVDVKEYTSARGLGDIAIKFLVLIPSYREPYIYKKTYSNWSIKGGMEAAFECLIDNQFVDSFEELVGTVFDAEIVYGVANGKMCAELRLKKMILPPQSNQ